LRDPSFKPLEAMRNRTITQPSQPRRIDRRTDHHPAPRGAEPASGEERTRAAGGPQDSALYACACGYAFAGDVHTHVACPKCGGEQVW
jgi:hypothetical protein